MLHYIKRGAIEVLRPIKISLETFLKESISFIIYFCVGKYSFHLDTFWTHLVYSGTKVDQLSVSLWTWLVCGYLSVPQVKPLICRLIYSTEWLHAGVNSYEQDLRYLRMFVNAVSFDGNSGWISFVHALLTNTDYWINRNMNKMFTLSMREREREKEWEREEEEEREKVGWVKRKRERPFYLHFPCLLITRKIIWQW